MCQNVFVNENENIVYTSQTKKVKDFEWHLKDFEMRECFMMNLIEKFNQCKPKGSNFTWF